MQKNAHSFTTNDENLKKNNHKGVCETIQFHYVIRYLDTKFGLIMILSYKVSKKNNLA